MIKREISKKLLSVAQRFPVVSVIGPRQSGKTTLVKMIFPSKSYVSLEDPDIREYAINDPRGFLSDYPKGAILDEVQRAPKLFSYIQTIVDKNPKGAMFVLTGSQHFLLHENISQTLAGRVAIFKLLPFTYGELLSARFNFNDYEEYLFRGFYPRIYDKKLNPRDWYPNYVQTYVERDVRAIKNVSDLGAFQTFLRLCAARIGRVVNLSSLANDCGITHNTAKAWLSVLETSFVVFLLRPHHKNFNKRLIKMPKIYFYDPGLACSLLGVEEKRQLTTHYMKGNLFENFILIELAKHMYNGGKEASFYFWRDKIGHEIDCVIEKGKKLIPIEMKSGKTASTEYFKDLSYWNRLSKGRSTNSYVVYGGDRSEARSKGNLLSWKNVDSLLERV